MSNFIKKIDFKKFNIIIDINNKNNINLQN